MAQFVSVNAKTVAEAKAKIEALKTLGAEKVTVEAFGEWTDSEGEFIYATMGIRVEKLGRERVHMKVSTSNRKGDHAMVLVSAVPSESEVRPGYRGNLQVSGWIVG